MTPSKPRIHIQDPKFPNRALCGRDWAASIGGRAASDTNPPVVIDDETGSVNPANCLQCVLTYRRRLAKKP